MLVFWLKLPIMEDLEVLVLGNVWNVVYIIIETLWNASIAITTCGIIALITLLGVALHFVEWTFVALASACYAIAWLAGHLIQRLYDLIDEVQALFDDFLWDVGSESESESEGDD